MKDVRLEWRHLENDDGLVCGETGEPFRRFLDGLGVEVRKQGAELDFTETPLAPGQESQHNLLLINGIAIEKWDVNADGDLAPCGSCADPTDTDRYLERCTEDGRTRWSIASAAVRTLVLKAAACLVLCLVLAADAFAAMDEVKALRAKIARKQSDAKALHALGVEIYDLGYSDDAILAWKRATELSTSFAEPYYWMGKVYYARAENADALRALKRAVEIRPDYAEAQYALGRVHLNDGRLEQALKHWIKASQAGENLPDVHGDLARLQYDLGQLDEAIASFRREIRVRPGAADAHYGLGMALGDKGFNRDAMREIETYLKLDKHIDPAQKKVANDKLDALKKRITDGQ